MNIINILAKEALNVQNACNLSEVIYTFSNVISNLRALGITNTDELNRHPICILYSSKIASLTGSDSAVEFAKAYSWVKEQVKTT